MKTIIGRDVAEEMLQQIYDDLCIIVELMEDEDNSNARKVLSALMQGRLEYKNKTFKLKLLEPFTVGKKEILTLEIDEPSGDHFREMGQVKNKNDTIGMGMAILGATTGLGLPVISKLKGRDLLTATAIIGLFF